MKHFLQKFKYFFLGGLVVLAGSVAAINVTVPQSTGYGQVLIGNNAGGGYTAVATSTLGISGTGGSDPFTHPATSQSATTSLMIFNGNASSTLFSANTGYFNNIKATSTSGTNYVLAHFGIGTTTNTELFTIDRPASDNDYTTMLAESGVVKGIFSASTPDLTVFAGSKSLHPFNLVMNNSSKLGIDTSGNINIISNSLNFNKGGDSATSNYNLSQTADGYLQTQRSGGADNEFSIFDLEAPTVNPIESTFTTGLNTGVNRNWVDWTDEAYATDNAGSINVGAKGSAVVQPFVIRFWPKTTFVHVHDIPYANWFDPSGAVAFGYASSTSASANRYDPTVQFQVSSSTAATVFAVDSAARTHLFSVGQSGSTAVATLATSTAGTLCISSSGVLYSCTSNTGTVTSVTLATPNSTLSLGGTNPVTTSGTINADLNLGHTNTWTVLQNFNYSSSTAYATFQTSSTTLGAFGQIGIGSSTPSTVLDVAGTSYFTNTLTEKSATNAQINQDRNATTNSALNVYRTAGVDQWSFGLRNDSAITATNNIFHIRDAVNSADALVAVQGAIPKVGIGTTTPISQFTVTNTPLGAGVIATTTVDFGDYATSTSHTCFNVENDVGGHISFYFNAANAMVIESNRCK